MNSTDPTRGASHGRSSEQLPIVRDAHQERRDLARDLAILIRRKIRNDAAEAEGTQTQTSPECGSPVITAGDDGDHAKDL